MPRPRIPTVFVVSDSRGDTAAQLLRATAVQFPGVKYKTVIKPNVRTVRRVEAIAEQAARARATIFYTLVDEEARRHMRRRARELGVPIVDILGPAFTALHHLFQRKRGHTAGLRYSLERERIDRMDAVDYTLKHDDGQRPHELHHADVVLVGVSRASKSATCFFLAYAGVRAANVPLVPGIDPPEELLALPPGRVIGLRVELSRLLVVREGRATHFSPQPIAPYVDRRAVSTELTYANRLMDSNDWRWINVSFLAVEEIAHEVMRMVQG